MNVMVTETLREKGSPSVDTNQLGCWICQELMSWTTPGPNVIDCKLLNEEIYLFVETDQFTRNYGSVVVATVV